MQEKLTMTPEEACQMYRACGRKVDVNTIRAGLIQGEAPYKDFGEAVKRKRWVYTIYRKKFIQHLKDIGAEVDL